MQKLKPWRTVLDTTVYWLTVVWCVWGSGGVTWAGVTTEPLLLTYPPVPPQAGRQEAYQPTLVL